MTSSQVSIRLVGWLVGWSSHSPHVLTFVDGSTTLSRGAADLGRCFVCCCVCGDHGYCCYSHTVCRRVIYLMQWLLFFVLFTSFCRAVHIHPPSFAALLCYRHSFARHACFTVLTEGRANKENQYFHVLARTHLVHTRYYHGVWSEVAEKRKQQQQSQKTGQ